MIKEMKEALDESLRQKISEIETEASRQRAEQRKIYRESLEKLRSICDHKNTYTLYDFNCHKREDWVKTYCEDCGKMLSEV